MIKKIGFKFNQTKSLHILCKFCGLMPLNHRKSDTFNILNYIFMIVNPIWYFISLITIFTYPVVTLRPEVLVVSGCKNICYFTYFNFLTLGGFTYLVCVISSFKKNKFFTTYYDEIEKFDQDFRKCDQTGNVKIRTDYVRIIIVVLLTVLTVCMCACGGITFFRTNLSVLGFILMLSCTVYPIFTTTIYQLLFASLIQEIGWRYEKINYIFRIINKQCNKKMNDAKIFDISMASNKIRKELESGKILLSSASESLNEDLKSSREESENEDDEEFESDSDDMPDVGKENLYCERFMVDLFQIHERISSLGVCANQAFSTAIVSYMTVTFIISIFGIFLLTKVVFTINDKYDLLILMTIYVILWTVYLLFAAYLILRICCHAQNESRKTALLIHEIMQKKPTFMLGNDVYYNKMKCFTLQYLHWETYFKFNGNGLFQLDYTFIFSAVSAGTSYLIVLLQFDLNAAL